ncbi:MAG: hypothetical protein M8353_11090 [ANME-2 cluster archaeon]|nr:hypothetical protein [ANME-2 cluster archaeon]
MKFINTVVLFFILMLFIPGTLGEGQWILTAVEEDIEPGVSAKEYRNDISSSIGEIIITREHFGTKGYDPYTQISKMTWSQMPTTIRPGDKITIQLVVEDGGSTLEYRNNGILSFSQAGKRDFDFIASKYRGMEEMVDYTMPEGEDGNKLFLKIDGSMGTKGFPSATYIYTYTFTLDNIEIVPLIETSGTVTLNTNGAVIPGVSGTLVKAGDVLLSGVDGKAVVSVKKGQYTMDKNTYVGIIDLDSMVLFTGRLYVKGSQDLELIHPGAGKEVLLDQYLIYRLKTGLDGISGTLDSGNDTDIARIVNDGGEFTVSISDAGNIDISILQGSVNLMRNGSTVNADAGESITVHPGGEPQVVAGVLQDEWWKAAEEGKAGGKQDSPGFSFVFAVAIVVLARFRKK